MQAAGDDRRLGKAHLKIQMGGMAAALEAYRSAPTPNVIILETKAATRSCSASTSSPTSATPARASIVIGRINDVMLYRELVRRGVSDYLIAPARRHRLVRSICGLFSAPEAKPVGRVIAVVGAKGGVGASTVAHNVAWAIARDLALDSVVADLDLAFGTAGLDYNQDPPQGIADAVFSPDRVDTAFIDRLLRNAPTISACWRHRRRSIASTISAPTPSIRSSTRCARRCPASCSTFRIIGRAGPSAR